MSTLEQPGWCVICTRAEEVTARDLRKAGYRVYVARYRRLLWPHGSGRGPGSSMVPLFRGMVFVQDWRGFPRHQAIGGEPRVMPAFRGAGPARVADGDIELIRAKENARAFDDIAYPVGPGLAAVLRDDIEPGEAVEFERLGMRMTGVLEELTDSGKAIVSALFFGRQTRMETEAATLQPVAATSGAHI